MMSSSIRLALVVAALASGPFVGRSAPVALTDQERQWLDRHGPLRYAPDPAFPPFEFFLPDGKAAGITPELLDLVAARLGTRIEILRYPSWDHILEAVKRHEVDIVGTITETPERNAFLLFTRPYLDVPYVLFARKDIPANHRIEDFGPARLGVVRHYGGHSWLQRTHPGIDPFTVETTKEGLLLVAVGRLDAMLETLPVGAEVIHENGLLNVRVLPQVLFSTPQHLAVARDRRVLLSILDKGLAALSPGERASVLSRWTGYDQLAQRTWPSAEFLAWAGQALFALLGGVVLLVAWNVSLRRHVGSKTRALRDSERRYRDLTDNLPQMVFLKDTESRYVSCNAPFARSLGIRPEEIAGRHDRDFFPPAMVEKYTADDRWVMENRQVREVDEDYLDHGAPLRIHTVKTPVYDRDGKVVGVLGIFWDISAQVKAEQQRAHLEDQLQQAQKMEAIGRLAGGVAHDFNNILTVILGNANLLAEEPGLSSDGRKVLGDIEETAGRGADLVRRLLAFSRRNVSQMRAVDLNEIAGRMNRMLRSLVGDHISIEYALAPGLPSVFADPTMIEQVILNLSLNARDAMADGGRLTIRTSASESNAPLATDAAPDRCVVLAVEDTGHGIDDETRAHLFEPFFTTKPAGKGTGLGLATVYSIVDQHGGCIDVESAPGRGSCFRVYLPAIQDESPAGSSVPAAPAPLASGAESILVVEDQQHVRSMIGSALRRSGYRVLEAENARAAMDIWEREGSDIDLVLTDIVMPGGMSGIELARILTTRRPGLRVLYSSGYNDDMIFKRDALPPGSAFLAKPYGIQALNEAVRRCLDSAATAAT